MASLKYFIVFGLILLVPSTSCRPRHRKRELFEGDMRLTREQQDIAYSSGKSDKKSVIVKRYLWPVSNVDGENMVKIPYIFGNGVTRSLKNTFKKVVADFKRFTCIRLVERKDEKDYLLIKADQPSCDSYVGYVTGEQPVNLGTGCQSEGHGIHELMHSLGFYHEQSRPDRDDFVDILENNIQDDAKEQFEKYKNNEGISGAKLDQFPYDIHSIMHYKKDAFSKNGQPTIVDKMDPDADVGQLKFFSTEDLFRINTIYTCPERYLDGAKTYRITIETSSDWWSGTDSRVLMEIYGKNGVSSGEIEMKKGQFEAGDIDVEVKMLLDETPIKQIVIWHSNEGVGASWKLEEVTIEDLKTNEKFEFVLDKWLEGNPPSNKKVLRPRQAE